MEVFIIDDQFRSVYNLDAFESLIWTERYNGAGNFEFYTPVSNTMLSVIASIQAKLAQKLDMYAWSKDSKTHMVIEDLQITTDTETGNHLIISGRGLESLLERRIIWDQTTLDGDFQNGIERLINESIINPSLSDRKIPNFKFKRSTNPDIMSLKIRAQYTGDNLYDSILAACEVNALGFDVVLDDNNDFVFTLIRGENRSYDQTKNPYVVFSPNYENIINSDYLESSKTLKNVTLVAGEDSGALRKKVIVGGATGLSRKELFTDARDVQSESMREQLDKDQEALTGYEEELKTNQESLVEENKSSTEDTSDYNKQKTIHQNRISALNSRISYWSGQRTAYRNALDAGGKTNYDAREKLIKDIKYWDDLSNGCSNEINKYNDKLNNETTLTYDKVVSYESAIASQESTKAGYDANKKEKEDAKSAIEESLPSFKEKLEVYEKYISKYEGIVANDNQSITDLTNEYNDKMAEHNKKIGELNTAIANANQEIAEYRAKIAEDERLLNEVYTALLEQRGREKLAENQYTRVFTGEVEAMKTFVYGSDFVYGDIVQIVNEYGMESKVRVSEVVRVQDTNGFSMYPTFQVLE